MPVKDIATGRIYHFKNENKNTKLGKSTMLFVFLDQILLLKTDKKKFNKK